MPNASIDIRSERLGDEDGIDVVVCQAFRSAEEANLVRMIRRIYPMFDRRFSVVAGDNGRIVGHVLFIPAMIRLMGRSVAGLAVAPVCAMPSHQKRGITRAMLEFGHDLGRREGFACAFLNGIPSFYPKIGYKACFGFGKITIDIEKLPEPTVTLTPYPVRPADVPWLAQRDEAEWADVDFSWRRGLSLAEWAYPGADAVIWRADDGQRAGYTLRGHGTKDLSSLLADDPARAREVVAIMRPPVIHHHPSGWLAREALDVTWANADAKAGSPAMAIALQNGALDEVISAVESDSRLPGCVNWPMPFQFC